MRDLHVYRLQEPFPTFRGILDPFPEPEPLPSDIDDTPLQSWKLVAHFDFIVSAQTRNVYLRSNEQYQVVD